MLTMAGGVGEGGAECWKGEGKGTMLNGMPSSELGRNALALTKLLGLGIAHKGNGESRRTRCIRTLTVESETYKYMHYYQIW